MKPPNSGQRYGFSYKFDVRDSSVSLVALAGWIEKYEKMYGYTVVSLDLDKDMDDKYQRTARIVFEDRRWLE